MVDENPYASPTPEQAAPVVSVDRLEPPQEIRFEFREEDYLATLAHIHLQLDAYQQQLSKGRWLIRWLAGMLLSAAMLFYAVGKTETSRIPLAASAALCGMVGLILLLRSFSSKAGSRKQLDQTLKPFAEELRDSVFFGQWTLRLEPDGLYTEDQAGNRFHRWSAVHHIEQTDDYLFVFYTKLEAVGVPSRAFVNEAGYDAYADLAERLWREHQTDGATDG